MIDLTFMAKANENESPGGGFRAKKPGGSHEY